MRYKITIEEITEVEGEKYPNKQEIYTQEREEIDLWAVIQAFNLS